MTESRITREQELTIHVVIMVLAVVSVFYGIMEYNFFWLAVAPVLLIGGLAFFIRRSSSQIGGKRGSKRPASDDVLLRLNSLERLAKLHRDGVLTADEYEAEKRKLLG